MRVNVNDRDNIFLHSVVVAHHSQFFATSLQTGIGGGAFTLQNVDVDIFRRMIVWMYTAEVEIRDTNDAVAFFKLASQLRVVDLELLCAEYFDETDLERDCIDYWEFGNLMRSDRLQQRVSIYVARKLRLLWDTQPGCEELTGFVARLSSQEAVADLLNMDALCVYLVVELILRWMGEHADEDADALMSRLRIERLPLACIERLSNAPRLKKASKRLKQCITSRRAILKERPAPVLFVGMYPPDFYEEDDRSAAGAHHSWEKVVRFDIENKTTTRLLDIPNKIGKATCVAVDDSVFVFGSDDRTVFMFLNEQWHVAGTLTSGYDLHSMSATAAGRHVVFVGAKTVAFDTSDGQWLQLPTMKVPRIRCTSASIDGRVFVFGGLMQPASGSESQSVESFAHPFTHPCPADEVFDMSTQTWQNLPTNIRRFDGTAVAVDKRIYIIGGSISTGPNQCTPVRTVESYFETTNTMSQHDDMYNMRSRSIGRFCVSVAHKRTIHVFSEKQPHSRGNWNFTFTERFDIASGKWAQCSKEQNAEFWSALAVRVRRRRL
jgi:hypothetical protein